MAQLQPLRERARCNASCWQQAAGTDTAPPRGMATGSSCDALLPPRAQVAVPLLRSLAALRDPSSDRPSCIEPAQAALI